MLYASVGGIDWACRESPMKVAARLEFRLIGARNGLNGVCLCDGYEATSREGGEESDFY